MVNNFGKFCRKLRIDRGERLFDMAKELGVSSAFLSKVENGQRKPPQEWRDKLIDQYSLDPEQIKNLDECIYEAQNYDSIDISNLNDSDKMLMLSFARKFDGINKSKLRNFLEKESDHE